MVSPYLKKKSVLPLWGLVVILGTITLTQFLSETRFYVPNSGPLLIVGLIIATYLGGTGVGLVGCLLLSAYYFGYNPRDGHFFRYSEESLRRGVVFVILAPVIALMIGYLKRIQERLREMAGELLELGRVRSEFVSSISHELKTPLTVITSTTNNLLEEAFGAISEEQRKWLQKIRQNSSVLHDMISKMLEVSRLQSDRVELQYEPVDAEEMIRSVTANLQTLASEKRLSLTFAVEPGIPRIWADRMSLERVLANLITNAVKFTPSGGGIRVSASCDRQSVLVQVSDDGPGIAPEHRDAIFEPFRQIQNPGDRDPTSAGVGLGLAICREIVGRHKGRIWVESRPGRGSNFIFSLPIELERDGREPLPIASGLRRSP